MSVMDEIRVASFFSGAGGLDLGFKSQGFDIIYAPGNIAIPLLNILINWGGGKAQCSKFRNSDDN